MEHPRPFTSCYRDLCFWHSWMTELLLRKALMLFLSAAPKEFREGFFALFACLSQHLIIMLYMCLAKLIPEVAEEMDCHYREMHLS